MAGFTSVTMLVKDPSSNLYTSAKVEASLNLGTPSSGSGPALIGGTSVFPTFVTGQTDSFGALTLILGDSSQITPVGTTWNFTVLNSTGLIGFALNSVTITGATQDISAALQAVAAPLIPNTSFTNVGTISLVEQASAPPGALGFDNIWANGAKTNPHRILVNMNNAGATPIAVFSDGLGVFASTTSAQLAAVVSDETGAPGPLVFASNPSLIAQNGLAVVYADQFASVQAAINTLPALGGTVDARSQNVNLALGAIDPGLRAVTLLLGPFAYTATQITLQSNFHLIGMGALLQTGHGVTSITSIGSNATPLIVIPQTSNTAAAAVNISGIDFFGAAANTSQKGLFADCSTLTNAGLWNSAFTDLTFNNFLGNAIHLKGRPDNASAVNQFLTFKDVHVFRPATAAENLRIENGCGQLTFIACEFDGPAITDGTNIFIGELAGGDLQSPYTIDFYMVTIQAANLGAQLSGVQGVTFRHCHWEGLHGGIQTSLVGTTANYNVVLDANDFFGTVGVNAGAGFIVKDNSGQTRLKFTNNLVEGLPDKIIIGTQLSTYATLNNSQTTSPPTWSSTNIVPVLNPAATLNCQDYRTVALNTSATAITTLQSALGPGEPLIFRAVATPVIFATGGNLNLGTYGASIAMNAGEEAVFIFDDNNNGWNLLAWNHGATVVNLTAQGANIGTTTAVAVPSTTARGYRIQLYSIVTRVATTSSTLPTVTFGWTDKNNAAAQTLVVSPGTPTGNSLTTVNFGTFLVNAAASTNITYNTTAFASVGGTSMQYALLITVEAL